MYLDPKLLKEARAVADQLVEKGEETGVFSPKSLTSGEGQTSFIVTRSVDGIVPLSELDVDGKKFYVGVEA